MWLDLLTNEEGCLSSSKKNKKKSNSQTQQDLSFSLLKISELNCNSFNKKKFTYKNTIDYTIKRQNMTNKIKDTTFYKNVYVHLTN